MSRFRLFAVKQLRTVNGILITGNSVLKRFNSVFEMDVFTLIGNSKAASRMHTVESTITSGFESVLISEIHEKLPGAESCKSRGRVFANVSTSQVNDVLNLRAVDNVSVVADVIPQFSLSATKEEDLRKFERLAYSIHWDKALLLWKRTTNFQGILYPSREQYRDSLNEENTLKEKLKSATQNVVEDYTENCQNLGKDPKHDKYAQSNNNLLRERRATDLSLYNALDTREPSKKVLKYRVTCYHSGKHSFGSQEAACAFGGALQDIFNWIVDLRYYDLEIVLNIKNDDVFVSIALTKESMHRRNIHHFGPTTLRSTICHCLLRLAEPKKGDIIIDPLCGGGSIPIEGALSFNGTFYVCGDIYPLAVERTLANLIDLPEKEKFNIDVCKWNVRSLPLKDSSIDVFVTDLPFGKRSGSKHDNRTLYKDVLFELARVLKRNSSRAVLLTQDRKNFIVAIQATYGLWNLSRSLAVNIGGLTAGVFVLKRTSKEFLGLSLIGARKQIKKGNTNL